MAALLWLLLCAAWPAAAHAFPKGSVCHASGTASESYEQVAADPRRWNCNRTGWSIAAERIFLRIDHDAATPAPARYTAELARFAHMRLTSIGTDGTSASRDLGDQDMRLATAGWLMSADLPRIGAPLAAVAVTMDGARHPRAVSSGRLTSVEEANGHSVPYELGLAMLSGMLFMGLLFNVVFYRVLKTRFLIWHTLSVAFMVAQTLITSGLIHRFVSLGLLDTSILSAVTFGAGVATGMLFAADFLEPGKLRPVQRRALRWMSLWIAGWTMFYLFADGPLRAYNALFYYTAFLPVLGLFVWFMATAWMRGSRAINFLIVAWAPFMLIGLLRVVTLLGLTDAPMGFPMEQHLALTWEVVIVNLGVADRVLFLRRERDRARARALALEARAERDPLTGLLNRRGVVQRFEKLRTMGYRAMAVIDLDHFKRINDTHGHMVGDEVLRAVAGALAQDEDIVAVRMGGEEFMLLVAGEQAARRAEQCRQAIPLRIASEVAGLDWPVTASMGFVEQPAGAQQADFAALYAHCDRLLYEAKAAGRNRTMSEKQTLFSSRKRKPHQAA